MQIFNFPLLCFFMLVIKIGVSESISRQDYWKQRKILLEEDIGIMLGHDLILSPEEEQVNDMLKKLRDEELERGFLTLDFPPSQQFTECKEKIDQSPVFKFMQKLPKGAVLHSHDVGITSVKWVISEITYWDDLYMCYKGDGSVLLEFFEIPDGSCSWVLVSDERANYNSTEDFDSFLFDKLTVLKKKPQNINEAWKAFFDAITPINGILKYRKAFEAYLYRALEEHMNDNVSYLELRSVLNPLEEKSGEKYDAKETFQIIEDVIKNFTSEHVDRFFGARIIYSPPRTVPIEKVWEYVDMVSILKKSFPSTLAGFDLPGQEDVGTPLISFLDPLLTLVDHDPPIQFFFHSGETNWNGLVTDGNLYDAILLNSSRLGHAYAIAKHPRLLQIAMEKDIAVELCPISNQIFKLIDDLRNHQTINLAKNSFPLVVSSDTPATWDSSPLSHDFYEFFMTVGGNADLKLLKKIVFNSVKYSSLDEDRKTKYEKMMQSKWNEFILETKP